MEDIGSAVTHQDDDLVLVHASKRGDMAAFERLVERYHGKPMCIAQNVTHDINDAQEVVQDAFFKAYQKLDQFRETARFSTWLVRIALNGRERAEMARRTPNPEQLCSAAELRADFA